MTAPNLIDPHQIARRFVYDLEDGLHSWFEGFGVIRDKDGDVYTPIANKLQVEVCRAIGWCLTQRLPIRIIILKPRQKGCSTISMAAMYWLMCRFGWQCGLMGGELSQTQNLMEYFRTYAELDAFPWGFERPVGAKVALFGNGARIQSATARNQNAFRSASLQALLLTEAARWADGKVARPDAVLAGAVKCVSTRRNSCIIMESTARGPTGFFARYYGDAVYLKDAMAGKFPKDWNGYIKIFSPWYVHDDSRMFHRDPENLEKTILKTLKGKVKQPPKHIREFLIEDRNAILPTYTPEEKQMAREYKLTPDQIRWHRRVMKNECNDEWGEMRMDYPKTPEEAFHASSNQWFNGGVLKLFRKRAEAAVAHYNFGNLEGENGNYTWHQAEQKSHGDLRLIEPPVSGLNYLVAVDVASLQTTTARDPDKHSALVIRAGFLDGEMIWHPPKVVCRTKYLCRWDADIIADRVYRMSRFYGNARIAVERNNTGEGLIQLLRTKGANLYRPRAAEIHGARVEQTFLEANYGFLTTGTSRIQILENLRKHIRLHNEEGYGLEFDCVDGVAELENFIVPENGTPTAAEGYHDDDVLALAIGVHLAPSHATRYRLPRNNPELSPDLMIDAEDSWGGGQWS